MTSAAWSRAQAALESKYRGRAPNVRASDAAAPTDDDRVLDVLGLRRRAS